MYSILIIILIITTALVLVLKRFKRKDKDVGNYIDKTKSTARALSTYYNEDTEEHGSLQLLVENILEIQKSSTPRCNIQQVLKGRVKELDDILKKVESGHNPYEDEMKTQVVDVCTRLTEGLKGAHMSDKEVKDSLIRR